jgi:outer membrane receptor protein involved in Fe transport
MKKHLIQCCLLSLLVCPLPMLPAESGAPPAETYDLISGDSPGLSEKSWNRFLWSTGARYYFNSRAALYVNAGSSFIPPSAKSVGGTLLPEDEGVAGHNGQLPNPDLKPESGLGFDFGTDLRLNNHAKFGARFFLNRVSDAIVENVVSHNPSQSQSFNAGNASSLGWKSLSNTNGRLR